MKARTAPSAPPPAPWIGLAASAYGANAGFGWSVAAGLLTTGRFRRVHSVLFIVTAATTVAAVCRTVPAGRAGGRILAPALIPLALLPYRALPRHDGIAAHRRLALAAAPFYVAALARSAAGSTRS